MVEHPQPDWTITKALDYLSDLYPQDRKSALDALRLAARQARVRITGCRCKWADFDAIEIGERENIRDLAWVDLAFEVRSSDWAAVQRRSSTMLPLPTMLPPVVAKLLVGKQEAKSRAAEGWYRLRIYGADVLSAFPKLDLAANLARFARAVAPPVPASTLSDKQATLPAVCPEPEGTAIEAKRQAATIAAASEPEVAASAGDIGEAAGSAATQPKRRRRLYEPTLDDWLRSQKINVLVNADREILAKKFDAHCREHRPDVAPLLPLRPRQMVGAIERHIAKRLKKIRQKAKIVASANSGQ